MNRLEDVVSPMKWGFLRTTLLSYVALLRRVNRWPAGYKILTWPKAQLIS